MYVYLYKYVTCVHMHVYVDMCIYTHIYICMYMYAATVSMLCAMGFTLCLPVAALLNCGCAKPVLG